MMDEMNPSLEASLDDLKVIYRVLGSTCRPISEVLTEPDPRL